MSHEPMTAGAVQKKSKIYGLSMTAVRVFQIEPPCRRQRVGLCGEREQCKTAC